MTVGETQISGEVVLEYITKTVALTEKVDTLTTSVDALVTRMNGCNPVEHEKTLAELQDRMEKAEERESSRVSWLKGAVWVMVSIASLITILNEMEIVHFARLLGGG